jgi:drug/metabolite transporter superfamily protein YnfA
MSVLPHMYVVVHACVVQLTFLGKVSTIADEGMRRVYLRYGTVRVYCSMRVVYVLDNLFHTEFVPHLSVGST